MRGPRRVLIASGLALLCAAAPAAAHEPIRGYGPNTIWSGATALEFHLGGATSTSIFHHGDREPGPGGREREAHGMLMVARGLTEDWLAMLELPAMYMDERAFGRTESAGGAGDVRLGAKWRFFREQASGQAWMAAVAALLSLPTGKVSSTPELGAGAASGDVIVTCARDALDLYVWTDARLRLPIPGGIRRAEPGVGADLAVGTRFWTPAYRGADLVPLVELNFERTWPARHRGHPERDSGHAWLLVGPGVLFFYDRFETKLGVQLPLWRWARGRQHLADVEVQGGVGVLF